MKQTKGRIDAETAELCGYAKNIGYVSLNGCNTFGCI